MTDQTNPEGATATPAAAPAADELKSKAVPSIVSTASPSAPQAPAAGQIDDEGEAEDDEEASAASDGDGAPERQRKHKGVGKRINELTREKYEAIRRAEAAETRIAQMEQATAKGQPAAAESGRPKREDFDFDEDAYLEALADWKVDQKLAKGVNATQQPTQPSAAQTRITTFAEKNPEAWQEAITAPVNYTEPMLAALAESEHIAELGVYLARHLDEADAISKMSAAGAIKAIARIEATFGQQPAASVGQPARVDPPKKLTNTPPPPRTLQGAAPSIKSIDDMSTEERIAHWKAKRAAR